MKIILRVIVSLVLLIGAVYGFFIYSFWITLMFGLAAMFNLLIPVLMSKQYKEFRKNLKYGSSSRSSSTGSSSSESSSSESAPGRIGPHVIVSTNGYIHYSYSTKGLSKCEYCNQPIEYGEGVLCDECNGSFHESCIRGYAYNDPDKPLCPYCYSRICNSY